MASPSLPTQEMDCSPPATLTPEHSDGEEPQRQYWGQLLSLNPKREHVLLPRSHLRISLGRSSRNFIVIRNSVHVSSVHCTIQWERSGRVSIEDSSSNGTFLSGSRLPKGQGATLEHGAFISLFAADPRAAVRKGCDDYVAYLFQDWRTEFVSRPRSLSQSGMISQCAAELLDLDRSPTPLRTTRSFSPGRHRLPARRQQSLAGLLSSSLPSSSSCSAAAGSHPGFFRVCPSAESTDPCSSSSSISALTSPSSLSKSFSMLPHTVVDVQAREEKRTYDEKRAKHSQLGEVSRKKRIRWQQSVSPTLSSPSFSSSSTSISTDSAASAPSQSEAPFFHVDVDALLASSCIESVQEFRTHRLVTLKRPHVADCTLAATHFKIAELAFRRFVNRDRMYSVKSVQLILNETVERAFQSKYENFRRRRSNNCNSIESQLQDPSCSPSEKRALERLKEYVYWCTEDQDSEDANLILAWHGTSVERLPSISAQGLRNLITRKDEGFFGKGIYLTHSPSYGEFYINQRQAEFGEEPSLILSWALLGRVKALTEKREGVASTRGFDSHFALVNGFEPCGVDDEVTGDEIVLFESAQALPRYVVTYEVVKKPKFVPIALLDSSDDEPDDRTAQQLDRALLVDEHVGCLHLNRVEEGFEVCFSGGGTLHRLDSAQQRWLNINPAVHLQILRECSGEDGADATADEPASPARVRLVVRCEATGRVLLNHWLLEQPAVSWSLRGTRHVLFGGLESDWSRPLLSLIGFDTRECASHCVQCLVELEEERRDN